MVEKKICAFFLKFLAFFFSFFRLFFATTLLLREAIYFLIADVLVVSKVLKHMEGFGFGGNYRVLKMDLFCNFLKISNFFFWVCRAR